MKLFKSKALKSAKTLFKTLLYWISEPNISHGSTFDDTSSRHQHYGEISSFNTRAIACGTSCTLFDFSSCRSGKIPVFVPGNNPRLSRFSWIVIGPCWYEWKVFRITVKSLWMMKNNYSEKIVHLLLSYLLPRPFVFPWSFVFVKLKDIVVLGACFVGARSIPFEYKMFKRLIDMTSATRHNRKKY